MKRSPADTEKLGSGVQWSGILLFFLTILAVLITSLRFRDLAVIIVLAAGVVLFFLGNSLSLNSKTKSLTPEKRELLKELKPGVRFVGHEPSASAPIVVTGRVISLWTPTFIKAEIQILGRDTPPSIIEWPIAWIDYVKHDDVPI